MSDPSPAEPTFEDALSEVERIVRELEDGSTGLEQSLAGYEAGIALLKHCYAKLRDAEQRIVKLAGCDGDGRPVLQPFEHTAAVEPEAAPTRRKGES